MPCFALFSRTQTFRSRSAVGSASCRSDLDLETARRSSFWCRVLWFALPFQLLLLLLVVLAFLLPLTEEDYCAQSNNFAHSFYPMLSYTNGPPPV
ncbi:Nesprin-1 [Ilyodon furcidens]|uniref:Nesprin-1 n=1 Tax=Ilyodon furcidens TaxID=33524 RepID=A0ABV0VHY3_9TELE